MHVIRVFGIFYVCDALMPPYVIAGLLLVLHRLALRILLHNMEINTKQARARTRQLLIDGGRVLLGFDISRNELWNWLRSPTIKPSIFKFWSVWTALKYVCEQTIIIIVDVDVVGEVIPAGCSNLCNPKTTPRFGNPFRKMPPGEIELISMICCNMSSGSTPVPIESWIVSQSSGGSRVDCGHLSHKQEQTGPAPMRTEVWWGGCFREDCGVQFRGLKFIECLSIQQSMKYSIDRLGRMKWNDVVHGTLSLTCLTAMLWVTVYTKSLEWIDWTVGCCKFKLVGNSWKIIWRKCK